MSSVEVPARRGFLNGWQRLGIVASAIWILLVSAVAVLEYDEHGTDGFFFRRDPWEVIDRSPIAHSPSTAQGPSDDPTAAPSKVFHLSVTFEDGTTKVIENVPVGTGAELIRGRVERGFPSRKVKRVARIASKFDLKTARPVTGPESKSGQVAITLDDGKQLSVPGEMRVEVLSGVMNREYSGRRIVQLVPPPPPGFVLDAPKESAQPFVRPDEVFGARRLQVGRLAAVMLIPPLAGWVLAYLTVWIIAGFRRTP